MEKQHIPLEGGNLQAAQISQQGELVTAGQEQLIHTTEHHQRSTEPHTLAHPHSYDHPPQRPEQPPHLTDDQLIHYHIADALREDRPIDHATARCIAAQLHGGQASALYALASTGAVVEGLRDELDSWRRDETPVEVEPWLDALDEYLTNREDDRPVEGWQQLWPAQPERDEGEPVSPGEERQPYGALASAIGGTAVSVEVEDHDGGERPVEPAALQPGHDEISAAEHHEDSGPVADLTERSEAQDRQDLMQRISAAGVTTLGNVATVVTISDRPEHSPNGSQRDHHETYDDSEEHDDFSWADAARWSPNGDTNVLARDRFDLLFGEIPDEELGSVEDMGWFGLLRNGDGPGGIVLSQNSYGFRHLWETSSDEELDHRWEQLQRECEAFSVATGAGPVHNREQDNQYDNSNDQRYRGARSETEPVRREELGSGHHPEIWVGSLSDYNSGRLHGVWLDATLDAEELRDAIAFMLRNGYDVAAEEWGIFDYDDFCGVNLGEYESLEVVSRIAKGIAEHGEAYAHWVSYVGERSQEQLSDEYFLDHYLGTYESTKTYVEHLLEECDAYSFEEYVPEWLKPYVKIDVELLARDSEIELYVVEGRGGGVVVFDGRG